MDLAKIKALPKISRPRRGKLRDVKRSSPSLTQQEFNFAKRIFNNFDIDKQGKIDYDELKALLLQLNLKVEDDVLDDYMELQLNINRSLPGSLDFDKFRTLYSSILSNQTEKPMNYQFLAERNHQDAKKCFYQYDDNQNGFLEADELKNLFLDMGHTQLSSMKNFDQWVLQQYSKFDRNNDGLISYEQFINLHNIVIDSFL